MSNHTPNSPRLTWISRRAGCILTACLLLAACSSTSTDTDTTASADGAGAVSTEVDEEADTSTDELAESAQSDETTETAEADEPAEADADIESASVGDSTFQIEVWADNWSAVYVDGELVGEDSVPITTERSFNAETYTFEASLPFTLAIEAKDFKETDSGIEYIGEQNQQMGDGGLIAQVTNVETGEVVAVTNNEWSALVVHQAPLNTECENDPDPDATCEFLILETPEDWATTAFDDSDWSTATTWSAADVDPKDGYDEITWDGDAELIWGTDLEIDNTVLLRTTIS